MTKEDYDAIYLQRKAEYDALHEKFNPDGSKLRKYQLHLVEVMKEFDRFCRQNDITYYIAYGTLLGAIRHKGFIPWDDDVDIQMTREEYQKLEKIMTAEGQLTDSVYVVQGIRPELWAAPFAYIDIFILEKAPANQFLRWFKTRLMQFAYAMVKCRESINRHNDKKFKSYYILKPIAFLAPIRFWRKWHHDIQQWWTTDRYTKDSKCYQCYNHPISAIPKQYPINCFMAQLPDYVQFEGGAFPIPNGFEELLKISYGDFMQIPDIDHIHVHGIVDQL